MIYETRINLRNKTKEELIMFVEEGLQVIQKYEAELEKKDRAVKYIEETFELEEGKCITEIYNILTK